MGNVDPPGSLTAALGRGSLVGRLVVVLAAFILLATIAVGVREYRTGEARLVGDVVGGLQTRASVAAERLQSALQERGRLVRLWSGLEEAQDLAVDDVDKRLASSLAELVGILEPGARAVAVGPSGALLSASDPAWVGADPGVLPPAMAAALRAPEPGVSLTGAGAGGPGSVTASADVTSRADGRFLGRIVVASPLPSFMGQALPLDLDALRLERSGGAPLYQGAALADGGASELWGRSATPDGALTVAVAAPRAGVARTLRASARQLATLAVLSLLLTLPAAVLVVRSTTGGLTRLTRAARELDPRSPQPLPAPSRWAPREVRVLAEALDSMVARLDRAREELARSESLAAVGVLTKSLAHEIRTPLSVLRGGTELLLRSAPEGSREREVSEMLEAEVDRLARLVEDLLVFGRPSPPSLREADLADVARSAVAALRPEADEKRVEVEVDGAPTPLRADPDQLRQVALNLVSNAVRACEGGGHVQVGVRSLGDTAELVVEDDGVGIPPELLDEIWTPLMTTHRSGNGLGLPIVKQIVGAHGGRVVADSTPGRGTRMVVTLPRSAPEDA